MGGLLGGSLIGGNTGAPQQTTNNQQASSQYGNVIGANARGTANTYNQGSGITLGSGFGSNLKNVGNNAGNIIKLNNQIGALTATLQRQQNNLGKFKTGSGGYNTVSNNIKNTQSRLQSLQNSLKAISNLNINASTNLTINPALDTGFSQLTSAIQNAIAGNAAYNLGPGNPASTNSVISGSGGSQNNPSGSAVNPSANLSLTGAPAQSPTGAQTVESPTIGGIDTTQLLVIAAGIGLVVLIARRF